MSTQQNTPQGTTSVDDLEYDDGDAAVYNDAPVDYPAPLPDLVSEVPITIYYDRDSDPGSAGSEMTADLPATTDQASTEPAEPADDRVLESEVGERRNPTVKVLGDAVDRDSLVVGTLIIVLWVLIWRKSGLYKTLEYNPVFIIIFFGFIAYMLFNVKSSGTTSGGVVYELNILLTVEQMVSILLGTTVVFLLFIKNLPVPDSCRSVTFRLSVYIMMMLTAASLWVNVYTSGRMFRAIRKFKQGMYNIALTLYIIIGLIYVKGTDCGAVSTA